MYSTAVRRALGLAPRRSVVGTLRAADLRDTLVVVNVRDPVERSASAYNALKSLDARLFCPDGACIPLLNFTLEGRAGEHSLDKLVRVLAGDYCCYNSKAIGGKVSLGRTKVGVCTVSLAPRTVCTTAHAPRPGALAPRGGWAWR